MEGLSTKEKEQLLQLLQEKQRREAGRKMYKYVPYDYQKKFINASDNQQKALMAANRIGKSDGGGFEMAMHATGEYPDWYTGRRFTKPVLIVCGGKTNTQVRDVAQSKLLGDAADPSARGTGFIPADKLGNTARKAGIPDALSSILVKHKSGGWSKLTFISYDSGKEGWMGFSADIVWLDEEPPQEIYSQALRAIVDRGGFISMTFTPENGITEVVRQFTTELKDGQYLQNATWDDAPHITEEVKEQILSALPPFERDMRSKGIPVLGSGLIYPVEESKIVCEPFEIPEHWPLIAAIDFGYDHDAAWTKIAWDRDEDVVYVVDCLKMAKMTPDQQVHQIRQRGGRDIPTAWPADGMTAEKGTGIALKSQYEGIYMLPEPFLNPPDPVTGNSNRSVEAGIMAILDRMNNGKFKIFQHLEELLREIRMYHRKDGKIVKKFDDAADSMRYAAQSLRHAETLKHKYQAYIPSEHEGYQDAEIAY